ncbi:MAG: hypothetical protein QXJ74_04350 [Nitrososphaera sp.]
MTLETLVAREAVNRITLRLPITILQTLKDDADRRDISLNAQISSVLRKNIVFENSVNAVPNITIPHFLFNKVLDNIDERFIQELAMEAPSQIRKSFMKRGIRYELQEVINEYLIPTGKYCGWYNFVCEVKNARCRIVFETHLGRRWTSFLFAYVKGILSSLQVFIEFESMDDNVIVFIVRTPDRLMA